MIKNLTLTWSTKFELIELQIRMGSFTQEILLGQAKSNILVMKTKI